MRLIKVIGLKGWLVFLIGLAVLIGILVLVFSFFVLLAPVIVLLIIAGILISFFRVRKKPKQKKDYLDVGYKIKP